MTKEFELIGEWFLPTNKDDRVHGTLNFHPEEGATLELYGSLCSDPYLPELKDEELILGLTSNSKQVVLYGCLMTKSGGATLVQGEETGKPSVIYSIRYILVGLHVNNVYELKFNRISSEINNLGEWVGISGFINKRYDFEKIKKHEISVEYKLPNPIDFNIDDKATGKFKFLANQPGLSRYQKSVSINQRVEFQVDSPSEQSIDDLLSYVYSFQNFLILALYRSTYPLSINLLGDKHTKDYGDGKPIRKNIKLYFSNSNRKQTIKPKLDFEMLFDYKRIKDDFSTIIKNWYKKYSLLEPAFNLLFEQFYNGNRFTVNTFLNLAQSAETFHARVHNHTKIPRDEYKIMKDEILKVTPTGFHKWLKDQFNFGNNLNLHARLTEITDKYSNGILDKIIDDKKLFVKQVKHSRNYYTHYSKDGKKKALKGSDLFYLTEKLKILLVCAFLMEVGFKNNQLTEFLDNVKWRLFNHLADWKDEKLEIPEVSDSDSGEVSDTIPVNFRTLVLVS